MTLSGRLRNIGLAVLVLGLIVAGVTIEPLVCDKRARDSKDGITLATVQLDDGSVVKVEQFELKRSKSRYRTEFRVRRYDGKTGKVLAVRQMDDDKPSCLVRQRELWCRWNGNTHRLNSALESVAGGSPPDAAEFDR